MKNTRVVLAKRPTDEPTTDDFPIEQSEVAPPDKGEVLLHALYRANEAEPA